MDHSSVNEKINGVKIKNLEKSSSAMNQQLILINEKITTLELRVVADKSARRTREEQSFKRLNLIEESTRNVEELANQVKGFLTSMKWIAPVVIVTVTALVSLVTFIIYEQRVQAEAELRAQIVSIHKEIQSNKK